MKMAKKVGGEMLIKVYPAIFEKDTRDSVGYGVYFPDVENAVTQGKSIEEAMTNASDALGIMLADYIEKGSDLPIPTDIEKVETQPGQFVSLIAVDLSEYLRMNESVKKTLQIPRWADRRAKQLSLNFSQTLTEAILQKTSV
jgi:predicted RNase H-like HicB family nuclease